MGTRDGLDNVENRKFLTLLELKFQSPGHALHSQLLLALLAFLAPTYSICITVDLQYCTNKSLNSYCQSAVISSPSSKLKIEQIASIFM
jgi:hypothetical protein